MIFPELVIQFIKFRELLCWQNKKEVTFLGFMLIAVIALH